MKEEELVLRGSVLSKDLSIKTLKEQHDELAYIAGKLDELGSCFWGIGLSKAYDELAIYSANLNDVCRKLKAVIESEEVK